MAIISVVHVDDIFPVGLKSRCDRFRGELKQLAPVKTLEELRWLGGVTTRRIGSGVLRIYIRKRLPIS